MAPCRTDGRTNTLLRVTDHLVPEPHATMPAQLPPAEPALVIVCEELLNALTPPGRLGGEVQFPAALDALLALAPPAVVAGVAQLCLRARSRPEAELTVDDLAEISRPYRYLVDLAGEEGIPLTAAGWMKPAYVERVYRDLGLDLDNEWYGKGNREDRTQPVARLRSMCQQLGLLRKHKGRLVRSPMARSLTTDEEHVAAVGARLLRDPNPFLQSSLALFALLTAASGRAVAEHAEVIAGLMTACGLQPRRPSRGRPGTSCPLAR